MQIPLSWNAVAGATSYNVYQGLSSHGEETTPIASGITQASYIATGLTDSTAYFFTVAAVNTAGVSSVSNEVSITPAVQPPGTNMAASFSIYPSIQASSPPAVGFNLQAAVGSYIPENTWLADGGFSPFDSRLSLTASQDGTTTTFIATENGGTSSYYSIATGYFVGATARTYRYSGSSWSLLRVDTIAGYTTPTYSPGTSDLNHPDITATDNTVTFSNSGPQVLSGDIIWIDLDSQTSVPGISLLDTRFSTYCPNWSVETLVCDTRSHSVPYVLSTDVPAADTGGLSLEVSDSTTETNGIWQYFQNAFVGSNQEQFQSGHTYEVDVWLKQNGIANGNVTFSISGLNLSHTFTGVTSTWQHFTWTFAAVSGLAAGSGQPIAHLDFSAPGTMWVDNFSLYDASWPPNTVSPQVLQSWTNYHPGTVRIWSNFGNWYQGYSFLSLNSWLTPEVKTRNTPGIGNEFEQPGQFEHLPDALANVKTIGASPWLIVNISLSEIEWGELIDYLCAPAGVGYAAMRPASHPGPYTADFNTIYVEVGNEEWGTQQVPADVQYGKWAQFVISNAIAGKSYFNASQIQFIVNGFDLQPTFGSTAIAAAPAASIVDAALYTEGNTTLSGDAYYQSDLVQLPVTNGPIINAIVAKQQADATNGLIYSLAAYEEGPGTDVTSQTGDPTLAAAIGALDNSLYASLNGFGPQNLFEFGLGNGPYTSHTYFANGFLPHPVWEAFQMRNNYCSGTMVTTVANSVPTYSDSKITNGQAVPLIAVYTFQDANVTNQADVVVISRSLNNQTPVTLNFPATPSGSANLYTLTGDPRQSNSSVLNIPIGSQALTGVTKSFTFTMPPGSVYIFQVPMSGTWSGAGEPSPVAPTNLTAAAGTNQVALTWTASKGATSYNVYQGSASGSESNTPVATGVTSHAYTVTGLTNEQAYFFTVSAVDAGGASGYSNEVIATPLAAGSGTILAYEPFAESSGALNGESGGGDFGWSGAWIVQNGSTDVPGYNISSATPMSYSGLVTRTNYAVGGDAYLSAGRELNINSGGPFNSYLSNGLIGAPGQTIWLSFLLRKDTSDGQSNWVGLTSQSGLTSWSVNPANIEVGYFGSSAYWGLQFNGTTVLSSVPVVSGTPALLVLELTFGATNVVNLYVNPSSLAGAAPSTSSATYSTASSLAFASIAYYGGDNPSQSSLANIRIGNSFASVTPTTVSAAPTGLGAIAGSTQAVLSWAASSGATSYNVYEGTASGGESATPIATGITSATYTVTGLTNGTAYYFEVAAVNAAGTSGYSNQATATPVPPVPVAPTSLGATAGNTQAVLSWTASSGATSYNVYEGTASGGESATPIATGHHRGSVYSDRAG